MSFDTSQLKRIFNYEEPNNKLVGKVINVVNQIPYKCFINNHDINDENLLEKIRLANINNHDALDATPISHLERRRRSTVAALGQTNIWHLSTRRGHSAMYAALDSLKKDYRTLYIGGTGAISTNNDKKLPVEVANIDEEERDSLKHLLRSRYDMVPIFVEDKLSYGHYEGYSKQGRFFSFLCVVQRTFPNIDQPNSSLAINALFNVVR